jgi:hypothetical protein
MRRSIILAVAILAALAGLAGRALAAEWNNIVPGETTQTALTSRYGPPSKTEKQKVEGYDTVDWIYEGPKAPVGMRRMVVQFGILAKAGYRPDVVRALRLEPKPEVFNRRTVINGWGSPSRTGREGDAEVFFYDEGLLVYFDKEGWLAVVMVFTPPQAPSSTSTAPRR